MTRDCHVTTNIRQVLTIIWIVVLVQFFVFIVPVACTLDGQSAAKAQAVTDALQNLTDGDDRLAFLKSWVGRYPVESKFDNKGKLIGPRKVVWDNLALKTALIGVLGEELFKKVTETSDLNNPIEQRDNWVRIGLASRVGEFTTSLIYVNFVTGEIAACLENDDPKQNMWLTNLPPTPEGKKSGTQVDNCTPRLPILKSVTDFDPLIFYGRVKLSDNATGETSP